MEGKLKAVQDSSRITEEVRNELDQTNKKLRDQNHDLEDKMKMYSDVEELFSQKRKRENSPQDLEFRAPLGSSGLPIQRKFPKESSGSRVQSSLGELRTPDSERVPEQCSRNSGPRVQNPFGAFRTPDSERAPQEASKNQCNVNAKRRKKRQAAYRTSNLN